MEWSSLGANNLAVIGFNAAGPFNDDSMELSFKNYRLSGLPQVGQTISCEYNPVTNLVIRLPSTEARRRELDCLQELDAEEKLLSGESYANLIDMLLDCPCSENQCLQDEGRFIRQEDVTDRRCYITTNPIRILVGQKNRTLAQQCCYSSNGYVASYKHFMDFAYNIIYFETLL